MVEEEFVTILNLSFSLDVLKVMRTHLAITDMLVYLRLFFVDIVPISYRSGSYLVNFLSVLLIVTKMD